MVDKKIYITIDLGTTSVKVSAIDTTFKSLICVKEEYQLLTAGNRVEVEPDTYWQVVMRGIQSITEQTKGMGVEGITITSQGETLIPLDEKGQALYRAVVWLDNRAGKQADKIRQIVSEEKFYRNTGIPECNGMCPISKLLWFMEEEPQIYDRTKYFVLLEDYIILKLTGRYVTEKSLLSTTGYFNLITDGIWDEILVKTGLDAGKIPEALGCGEIAGTVLPDVAGELGIEEGAQVVTGAMDQVCGAIGAGNVAAGTVTETTGTALCIGATVGKAGIHTEYKVPVYRHFSEELFLLLPVCMTAGMTLKWFKDNFCKEEAELAHSQGGDVYELLNILAAESEPLSGGMLLLPYLSGSLQPFHNPDMRGSFLNVGLHNTKQDFVRSIMEGVGYMLKENLLLLEEISGNRIREVISMGGGAKSSIWCQIKADINNITIEVDHQEEMTSMGAAFLCSIGLKKFHTIQEIMKVRTKETRLYEPKAERVALYQKGFRKYTEYVKYFAEK